MKIQFLAQCPEAIPTIASWLCDQFKHIDRRYVTCESTTREMNRRLSREGCPVTFISLEEGMLTGTASFVETDYVQSCAHLTPWLSDIFVQPTHRKCGHGTKLIQSVCRHAKRNRYEKIYLFTEDRQAFYSKMGWIESLKVIQEGVPASVMELKL